MRSCRGNGGTSPHVVAEHVVNQKFHGHLVLATDGQVGTGDVDRCDGLLAEWTFDKVEVLVIGHGANKSVHVPFCRNSPHETVYTIDASHEDISELITMEELNSIATIQAISTLADWQDKQALIAKGIYAKTVGTVGDAKIRDDLIAMKSRIIRDEASKVTTLTSTEIRDFLVVGDTTSALAVSKRLITSYYAGSSLSWAGEIDRLISAATGALRSAFGVVSNAVDRAAVMSAAPTEDVPLEEADGGSSWAQTMSECIILLTPGVMAINFADGSPILQAVEKNILSDITTCPLNFLNYPDLVSQLAARFCSVVSVDAIAMSAQAGSPMTECPLTRQPLLGAVPLGPNAEHRKAGNWTLANLLFGQKLVGNADLWFAVLLVIVTKELTTGNFREYLPQMRAHMVWRMQTQTTYASLVGLAEYPTSQLYLDEAVWFVLSTHEVGLDLIRVHLSHLDALLLLNGLMTTSTDASVGPYHLRPSTELFIDRTRVLMSMLSWVKADRHTLPNLMRALYQMATWIDEERLGEVTVPTIEKVNAAPPAAATYLTVTLGPTASDATAEEVVVEEEVKKRRGKFIFLDGAATTQQLEQVRSHLKPQYQRLDEATLVKFCEIVINSNLSAKTVLIPPADYVYTLPEPVVKWPRIARSPVVPVCPATCRPYSVDRTTGLPWGAHVEQIYEVTDHKLLFSGHALFGRYVARYNTYPTKALYLEYASKRHDVLPSAIYQYIDAIFESFVEVMSTVTAVEFGKRFNSSCALVERERVEKEYLGLPAV